MAMMWLPLDGTTIERMLTMAGASWARADFDATWRAAGWPMPGGASMASQVFDEMTYAFATGDRLVRIGMRFDPDTVTSVSTDFATLFGDPDDPDTPDAISAATTAGWLSDLSATRADFDTRYQEAVGRLATRIGPPAVMGRHGAHWGHAVWRVKDTLIVVAQGENVDSYGQDDDACLWAVRYPVERTIPEGDALYAMLFGDAEPSSEG